MKNTNKVKETIKKSYGKIAKSSQSCSCDCACTDITTQDRAEQIGYSKEEIGQVPSGSNLGLGCGNPTAIASLKKSQTVLDLGSGAGFDTFLAAKKVGKTGKVIGIDMTDEMVKKARKNAKKGGFTNVEFRKGDIEDLPVDDKSVDVVISNCVINLASNKRKVFKEAFRVLKPGGWLAVSDIVLIKLLPEKLKKDKDLLIACIAGAELKKDYLRMLKEAGFSHIKIHKETSYFKDYASSITFSAVK